MRRLRIVDVLFLPGMDGTGQLYSRLMKALPRAWRMTVLAYPTDTIAGYGELLQRVRLQAPERPFVLVAESYSTPLAIRFAAAHPEHLKGVVLCAGFASSPVIGWKRLAARLISPLLFRFPLSDWILQRFLVGVGADRALMDEVRSAIVSVRPSVLAARLREILDCNVLADLSQVDVPLLYLQASRDRLVHDESLAAMRQNHDDLIVRRMDGPHLLFQREVEQSANAIEQFVRNL